MTGRQILYRASIEHAKELRHHPRLCDGELLRLEEQPARFWWGVKKTADVIKTRQQNSVGNCIGHFGAWFGFSRYAKRKRDFGGAEQDRT